MFGRFFGIIVLFSLLFSFLSLTSNIAYAQVTGGPPENTLHGPGVGEGPPTDAGPPSDVGPKNVPSSIPEIPSEVRTVVPEKDFIDLMCYMTRWKSGEMFAAIDAVGGTFVSAVTVCKIDFKPPDVYQMKEQANAKVDAVCNAQTIEQARTAAQDMLSFASSSQMQGELKSAGDNFQKAIEAKTGTFQSKIESAIEAYVAEQEKIESESIKAEAESYVSEYESRVTSGSSADSVRSDIEGRLSTKVEQSKTRIDAGVKRVVEETLKQENMDECEKLMGGIEKKIAEQANSATYTGYKKLALEKQRAITEKITDYHLIDGKKKIEEARSGLEDAKKNDPSVKDADELLSEMETDKKKLLEDLDQAGEVGDDAKMQSIINAFKNKWEAYGKELEKAKPKPMKLCSNVMSQIDAARPTINEKLTYVDSIQASCEGSTSSKCKKVQSLSPKFTQLKTKLATLVTAMDDAKSLCAKVTDETPYSDMKSTLEGLKSSYDNVKALIDELQEEEKSGAKAEKSSEDAFKYCSGVEGFANAIYPLDSIYEWVKEKCTADRDSQCQAPHSTDMGYSNVPLSLVYSAPVCTNALAGAAPEVSELCALYDFNDVPSIGINREIRTAWDAVHSASQGLSAYVASNKQLCFKTDVTEEEGTAALAGLKQKINALKDAINTLKEIHSGAQTQSGVEVIIIEAEEETRANVAKTGATWDASKEINPTWRNDVSGGDWYLSHGGDTVEYDFDTSESGTYYLWIRDWSDTVHEYGARAANVIIDSKDLGSIKENPSRGSKGSPWDWQKVALGDLSKGAHTLKIKKTDTTSAAAIVDEFVITNIESYSPSAEGAEGVDNE